AQPHGVRLRRREHSRQPFQERNSRTPRRTASSSTALSIAVPTPVPCTDRSTTVRCSSATCGKWRSISVTPTVTDRPCLLGASCFVVLFVGFRLREPLGDRDEQPRDVVRHLPVELCDPCCAAHATESGVIAATFSRKA